MYREWLGPACSERVKATIGGRYARTTTGDPDLPSIRSIADMRTFLEEALVPDGPLARTDGRVTDGVPTVGLEDTDANRSGVIYVSDDNEHSRSR